MAKTGIFILLFLCCISFVISSYENDVFELFKIKFNKLYSNSTEEEFRKLIFIHNFRHYQQHNRKFYNKQISYKVGINEHSDKLSEENKFYTGYETTPNKCHNVSGTYYASDNVQVPDSIDWRNEGAVTPVKNQHHCGSCWAFAATGALEGQNFLKTKKLVSLSEQDLVECSHSNLGCKGGSFRSAFCDIRDQGGIDTEVSYPYLGYNTNECHFNKSAVGAHDEGYVQIHQDEESLKQAVALKGPMAVSIDARNLSHYAEGIFENPDWSKKHMHHAVLVVGYGTNEDGQDYWIVKNSWGTKWGMKGYFLLARNKGNMCGVALHASYPIVN